MLYFSCMRIEDFEDKLENLADSSYPIACTLGAAGGFLIGLFSNGLGGGILGALIGAVVGAICVGFLLGIAEAIGRFAVTWGIVIAVLLAIYFLWGVGKP
jgi:hypothetical protein